MEKIDFFEDKTSQLLCADGIKRPTYSWESKQKAKGVLVAIHGAMAHGRDYSTMATSMNQRGWHMVSFDMRGHNRQKKVHFNRLNDLLDDLGLFINWAKAEYPGLPVFIVGHSMGGLLSGLYALNRETADDAIQGYILSAPYWANAVRIAAPLKILSNALSKLTPTLTAPTEDFIDVLTHDAAITARHKRDEAEKIRASGLSCRVASELLKAHKRIAKDIHRWQQPLFLALAGDDNLTDTPSVQQLAQQIEPSLLEEQLYADNYHENFNELNREQIFDAIDRWLDKQLNSTKN